MLNGQLLRHWSDGFRCTSTECKRPDKPHFDSYCAVRDRQLEESLAHLREKYPVTNRKADWHIVLSNAKRAQLNDQEQREHVRNFKAKYPRAVVHSAHHPGLIDL